MTINLLTSVPAGMVLLADSMLTLSGQRVTTFENAEKLIEIGADRVPAAAMISGVGDVGGKLVSFLLRKAGAEVDANVANGVPVAHADIVAAVQQAIEPEWLRYIADLRKESTDFHSTIDELAKVNDHRAQLVPPLAPLVRIEEKDIFVEGLTDNDPAAFIRMQPSTLTIVVVSYFGEDPKATEIWWPGMPAEVLTPLRWWGSGSAAVARLVLGYDFVKLRIKADAEARLAAHSLAGGTTVGPEDAQKAFAYLGREQADFQMGLPMDALPLQDAIEFTEYLGKVASGFDQFSVGPAAVGGPLDVLVLLPNERQWIHRKVLHTSQG